MQTNKFNFSFNFSLACLLSLALNGCEHPKKIAPEPNPKANLDKSITEPEDTELLTKNTADLNTLGSKYRGVWIATSHVTEFDENHNVKIGFVADFMEQFKSEGTWAKSRKNVSLMKFYVGSFIERYGLNSNNDEELKLIISKLKAWNIGMAFEVAGATGAQCNSDRQKIAAGEIAFFKKIYQLGGTISALDLDSPISAYYLPENTVGCTMYVDDAKGPNPTYEKAYADIKNYIVQVKNNVDSKIRVGLTDPLPNRYVSRISADYKLIFGGLVKYLNATGDARIKIDFIHIDNPYDFILGGSSSWDFIFKFEKYVSQTLKIKTGLIINSARAGMTSNQSFYEESSAMLDDFIKKYSGIMEDGIILQSWFSYPNITVPETTQFTFMNLLLNLGKKLDAVIANPAPTNPYPKGFLAKTQSCAAFENGVDKNSDEILKWCATNKPAEFGGSSHSHKLQLANPPDSHGALYACAKYYLHRTKYRTLTTSVGATPEFSVCTKTSEYFKAEFSTLSREQLIAIFGTDQADQVSPEFALSHFIHNGAFEPRCVYLGGGAETFQ